MVVCSLHDVIYLFTYFSGLSSAFCSVNSCPHLIHLSFLLIESVSFKKKKRKKINFPPMTI